MDKPVIYFAYHKCYLGELKIGVYNNAICMCDWRYRRMRVAIDERLKKFFKAELLEAHHPLITEFIHQLQAYFDKKLQNFNIPIVFAGTAFQQNVWQHLIQIPYGTTISYSALAQKMNMPDAVRAVATANGANAISIVVPCHRIIGNNGDLVGYAGGLTAKQKLLTLENPNPPNTLPFWD